MLTGVRKKGTISEADSALLLNRYSATTVLALLHEVSKYASAKIDWNYLIKHTRTGITNAREYQMLWRHLAYRKELPDTYEDTQPVDDDSDLEFEIEPLPAVGSEALVEAAACVKVLACSGTSNISTNPSNSTVEAPLTINVPSSRQAVDLPENQKPAVGVNITVPVSIQKQRTVAFPSSEGIDGNASGNSSHPVRKKRKKWTLEEDDELIAAVQKCGEGNWSTILKGAFKHDRTASQLSQRWSLIRKRQQINLGSVSATVGNPDAAATSSYAMTALVGSSASNSEAQGAVASHNITGQPVASSGIRPSVTQMAAGTSPESLVSHLNPTLQAHDKATTVNVVPSNACSQPAAVRKSRQSTKKQATKADIPSTTNSIPGKQHGHAIAARAITSEGVNRGAMLPPVGPHPMVQAAAMAAGARIAPASAAASILKAAQSGNIVHIGPGISVSKTGHAAQGANACGTTHSVISTTTVATSRPSNVHYIQTGPGQLPSISPGSMSGSQVLHSNTAKSQLGKLSSSNQSASHANKPLHPSSTAVQGSVSTSPSQALNITISKTPPLTVSTSDAVKMEKHEDAITPSTIVTTNLEKNLPVKASPIETSFPMPVQSVLAEKTMQVSGEKLALPTPIASSSPTIDEIGSGAMQTGVTSVSSSPNISLGQEASSSTEISAVGVDKNAEMPKDQHLQSCGKAYEDGKDGKSNIVPK